MELYYEPYEVEHLIAEVKARPVIWNSNTEEYMDKTKKVLAWQEVFRECVAGWDEMSTNCKKEKAKEVQKRWKNVRDHYVRELKWLTGAPVKKKRRYIYFDRLSFLSALHQDKISSTSASGKNKTQIGANETSRDAKCETEEDSNEYSTACDTFPAISAHETKEGSEYDISELTSDVVLVQSQQQGKNNESTGSDTFPVPEIQEKRTQANRRDGNKREVKKFKNNVLDILRTNIRSREIHSGDEDRLFLLSLVSELKRVPVERKLMVKSQIIQAILQGQQYSDSNNSR